MVAASALFAQTRPERHDGFVPFYWDVARGRILFEIPKLNEDLLYFAGAGKGIGSVELGVDRGASYASTVVYFERVGPRVQIVQRNLKFRALSGNAALQKGMEESFASSVLASLAIESEQDGKLIVDATPFLVRDAVNIEGLLRRQNQGSYKLDPARSSIYLAKTKAFPKNTEVEVTLTYASDTPGPLVNAVAPDGKALTIRLHHSFVKPPDDGYKPRAGDPRIGAMGLSFKDLSAPYDKEPDTHWVRRFRLEKKDPTAKVSEPKEPLVYYLDAGIPEPIRSAMRDGILWWNAAFEAAGFRNTMVVKDPTPDMDPMDIRYNFVFWVNRDDRGFSVGGSYSDPRTGEILAARARMDSARIRTISNYWKSYKPEMTTGGADDDDGPFLQRLDYLMFAAKAQHVTQESLVTLRQALVTAHEVGHTLGFPHAWNSSMNDRASVMEYPSPRIKLTADGKVDLSDAFQRQIGEFDKYMVRYSYTELPSSGEKQGLNAIVAEMRGKGFVFTPATDPRWNRYDDLGDAATYLREAMKQRKVLMSNYGLAVLELGEDISHLRGEGLWMTYLHHRWAIDSGVRYIGGMYHNYVVKGDTLAPTEIVPAAFQRDILGLLMNAVQPQELVIPESLLVLLTTDPSGRGGGEFGGTRSSTAIEEFNVSTGYAFDHLSATRTLADMVIGQLLDPEKANRLISFADRQDNALTLPETINKVLDATWNAPRDATPMLRSLRRVTRQVALDDLMMLGANPKSTPETRAVVIEQLVQLKARIAGMHDADAVNEATLRQSERDLTRYLVNPSMATPKAAALAQPAGAPL
ncbi:MAG: hypothetical protein JWO80_2129 [Bryobacterales bacterium]|nr:hypothetical protein [Bryobacterales bacterium]